MSDLVPQELLSWRVLAVALWVACLFALERLLPAALAPAGAGRFGWRRLARNAVFWLIGFGVSPLLVLPITVAATGLSIGPLGDWRPDWFGGPWGLVVDLLLLDLFIYGWHRANHALPLLWRFHEVHHLDRFLDTSSALRFHFGELVLSGLVRGVFIVLADVPLASVLVFEGLVLAAAVFHHSNVRLPRRLERALSAVIITPAVHWVHHHAVRADTDSNYGTLLVFWDRLFASLSATRRWPDMPIGVERLDDESAARLLLRPFRRRRDVYSPRSTEPAVTNRSPDNATP